MWAAYRENVAELARKEVAGIGKSYLAAHLRARGLPEEVGLAATIMKKARERLLASLFEHPAYAWHG